MTRRASSLGEPVTIQEGRDLAEKKAILQALTETGGNRENAARLLNISPAHLYRKLKQFGIKGIMISGRRRRKITSGGATENTGAPSPELGGMKCELA